jgi:molecular chaperone DnaK
MSGKEQSIRIEARSGLTDADIEKMKHDAEAHAEEDRLKKESAESRNIADQLVYTAEKSLKDAGDKVSAEVKASVEEKIAEVKKLRDGADTAALKQATEALSTEMQKIGQSMNQQTPPTPPPAAEQGNA